MTVQLPIEEPVVKTQRTTPTWEQIKYIVAFDKDEKLRRTLEEHPLHQVMRPKDAQHHKTALNVAILKDSGKCLEVLLQAIPSQELLDAPDIEKASSLHIPVKNLNTEIVEELLEASVRNSKGHSSLHLLAYKPSTKDD